MSKLYRTELAADTINGVYFCANSDSETFTEILFDMEFYENLSESFEGVIFGNVSPEIFDMIEKEYGFYF